jgi:hypothetical protein
MAGLSACKGRDFFIDLSLANARDMSKSNSPIQRIWHFENINFFCSRGKSKINKKVYLYLYRISSKPNGLEATASWRGLVTALGSIYFSIIYFDLYIPLEKNMMTKPLKRRVMVLLNENILRQL